MNLLQHIVSLLEAMQNGYFDERKFNGGNLKQVRTIQAGKAVDTPIAEDSRAVRPSSATGSAGTSSAEEQ